MAGSGPIGQGAGDSEGRKSDTRTSGGMCDLYNPSNRRDPRMRDRAAPRGNAGRQVAGARPGRTPQGVSGRTFLAKSTIWVGESCATRAPNFASIALMNASAITPCTTVPTWMPSARKAWW